MNESVSNKIGTAVIDELRKIPIYPNTKGNAPVILWNKKSVAHS